MAKKYSSRYRRYHYATGGMEEYTVGHHEIRHPPRPTLARDDHSPCGFMTVSTTAGHPDNRVWVQCTRCGGSAGEDGLNYYYSCCRKEVSKLLFSNYPTISDDCAVLVIDTVVEFLVSADADYCCPYTANAVGGDCTVSYHLDIDVCRIVLTQEFITRAAGAPLAMTPVNANVGADDKECSVCMNDMTAEEETETVTVTVTMPCAHTFHRNCLDRWFDTSLSCPLCRYRLPTF